MKTKTLNWVYNNAAYILIITLSITAIIVVNAARATSPISISSCEELQKIGNEEGYGLGDDYVLTGDIDCLATVGWNDGAGFDPIGDWSSRFVGTFDGGGYTISDLVIDRVAEDTRGLFGVIEGSSIKNVSLVDVYVRGKTEVGSIAGQIRASEIENVHASGTVIQQHATSGDAGGLVGAVRSDQSTIKKSSAAADVTGDNHSIGGLVGWATDVAIQESHASGDVVGNGANNVGGLIGNFSNGTVKNSYATGSVSDGDNVGGLFGHAHTGVSIEFSYSAGSVSSGNTVGGLGASNVGSVTNSFWDKDTSGQSSSAAGTGKTTSEMKDITTYTDTDLSEGLDEAWDFVDIWSIDSQINDGYPYHNTGEPADDFNNDGIPDSAQNYVSSITNLITGKTVALKVDDGCEITTLFMQSQDSLDDSDSGYNYSQGLMNFTLDCGTPGYITAVTKYYYGVSEDDFTARKYNPDTGAFFSIDSAEIDEIDILGQTALRVVYEITDGGELDIDGEENGIIVDPVGLGIQAVSAPNTGLGGGK